MIDKRLIEKFLSTGMAKVVSALSGVCLTYLIALIYNPDLAGVFFFAYSVFISAGTILRVGIDNILLKEIAITGVNDKSRALILLCSKWIIKYNCLVLVLFYLLYLFLPTSLRLNLISIILIGLPFYCLFYASSFVYQGLGQYLTSVFYQNLGINFVFIFCIYFFSVLNPNISLTSCGVIFIFSNIIIFLCTYTSLLKKHLIKRTKFGDESSTNVNVIKVARNNFWLASCMSVSVQWSGIIIGGFFLSNKAVAMLSIAQRSALLISFALMVVNIVVTPKYSKFWHEGKLSEIKTLAQTSSALLIISVLPLFILLFIFSGEIMSLFGDEFYSAKLLFEILVVGQFFNLATGSVGYLLNMTGHEVTVKKITVSSGLYSIITSLIFTYYYGVIGTAISISSAVILQNFLLSYHVKRKLNFLPINVFNPIVKKFNQ